MKLARRKFCTALALPHCLQISPLAMAQVIRHDPSPSSVVRGRRPTDTIGRIITERMRNTLGQTMSSKNNGAAAGALHMAGSHAPPRWLHAQPRTRGTHVGYGAV